MRRPSRCVIGKKNIKSCRHSSDGLSRGISFVAKTVTIPADLCYAQRKLVELFALGRWTRGHGDHDRNASIVRIRIRDIVFLKTSPSRGLKHRPKRTSRGRRRPMRPGPRTHEREVE